MNLSLPPLLAILLASACLGDGDDRIFGTYTGLLQEADLDQGYSVEEADSSFTLVLEPGEDGVAGRATLQGRTKGPLGTFDGTEVVDIPEIHIDGDQLRCVYEGQYDLRVRGTFAPDFTELDLDVQYFGLLFLDLQEEEVEKE